MNDILLVIDMQNVYKDGQPWGCPNLDQVIGNIKNLLHEHSFEAAYFTRHVPFPHPQGTWQNYNLTYRSINQDPQLGWIVDELLPYTAAYPVFDKSTYSCVPVLPLKPAGSCPPRIVITGVVAQCCILATAFDLIDLGYPVIYLEDAIAGEHQDFEDMTRAILSSFSPLHTRISTTDEYLAN